MKDRESGRNCKVTSVYGYLSVCAYLLDRAGKPISMSTGSKTKVPCLILSNRRPHV